MYSHPCDLAVSESRAFVGKRPAPLVHHFPFERHSYILLRAVFHLEFSAATKRSSIGALRCRDDAHLRTPHATALQYARVVPPG